MFFKANLVPVENSTQLENEELIRDHIKTQAKIGKLPIDNILTTEKCHPKTLRLSQNAEKNLPLAIDSIKAVDIDALTRLREHGDKIDMLRETMLLTFKAGNKIFISGCGAAGRAALLVEKEAREAFPKSSLTKKIIAIVAGGDGAAVKGIESFEDSKEYGIKQLQAMDWQADDLLIVLSASGSAEFIHGQLEYVAQCGNQKPCFLYCNSDEELALSFAHKPLFANETLRNKIYLISINVGPMALAGSTRMQAATAQVLTIGFPLLDCIEMIENNRPERSWRFFIGLILLNLQAKDLNEQAMDLKKLAPLIEAEANCYINNERIYYCVPAHIGLNVLTDTTERSPTFNLDHFEHSLDEKKSEHASLCRVIINRSKLSEEAWEKMLLRKPNALNWTSVPDTHLQHLYGYDLSSNLCTARREYLPDIIHHQFKIFLNRKKKRLAFHFLDNHIIFDLRGLTKHLPKHLRGLAQQVTLKIILNAHSTLVMGRLGLYHGNLMVCVKPSNIKLISRGIRLVYELIEKTGVTEHAILPAVIDELTKRNDYKLLLLGMIANLFYKKMQQLEVRDSIVLDTEHEIAAKLEMISSNYLFNEIVIKSRILTENYIKQIAKESKYTYEDYKKLLQFGHNRDKVVVPQITDQHLVTSSV